MEVLESFDGYVDSVDGDTAYVTLESRFNGDVMHGEYSAKKLMSIGIKEQDRFLCETIKDVGLAVVRISPMAKNEISDQEAHEIAIRISDALLFDTDLLSCPLNTKD